MTHAMSCASHLGLDSACDCPVRLERLVAPLDRPDLDRRLAQWLEAEQAAADARWDLITALLEERG